ncbi:hypothetical protein CEXT_602331 [Caerostris extrusa]|uniref:Uncharacterized protein n=1 Tax=Caerostris extrusa TaxID=172846 RepID=A0AAV4SLD1_CAEEX|nr:hypothetical protein CEXT_602331 [Caerostris extrusa]
MQCPLVISSSSLSTDDDDSGASISPDSLIVKSVKAILSNYSTSCMNVFVDNNIIRNLSPNKQSSCDGGGSTEIFIICI